MDEFICYIQNGRTHHLPIHPSVHPPINPCSIPFYHFQGPTGVADEQNVKSARHAERCVIHPRASYTKLRIRRPVWFLSSSRRVASEWTNKSSIHPSVHPATNPCIIPFTTSKIRVRNLLTWKMNRMLNPPGHPRASSTKLSIRRPVWFLSHPAEWLQALPKFPGRNTAIQHTTASAPD